MKYPIESKIELRRKASKKTDAEIGMLYNTTDSIDDFKIKAGFENYPKLKVFLLVAYYNLWQNRRIARLIVCACIAVFAVSLCLLIEFCTSKSCYVSALFGGIIISITLSTLSVLGYNYFLDAMERKFGIMT